jgi:hypothetical protein
MITITAMFDGDHWALKALLRIPGKKRLVS